MSTYIYSYNPHSASAKALAEALGVKRIKHHNSKFKNRIDDVVINWGSSSLPFDVDQRVTINDPFDVKAVTNKLSFFEMIDEELTVPWTTEQSQVQTWLSEGRTVVARQKLTGHSGDGIVVFDKLYVDNGNPVPPAPLYTLYVPKKEEYRVHCCLRAGGIVGTHPAVFDVQRKARKLDVPNEKVDWRVRNLNGGFIYQRLDIDVPAVVTDVALKVFEQTGLDFAAIDIIYNKKDNKALALEANTAPGLAGTTLEKYVEMFKEIV